jgi:hypothetical protein
MAAVRAPTMARTIQSSCRGEGMPFAASNAPDKANGSAKIVWENLIISRKILILAMILYCCVILLFPEHLNTICSRKGAKIAKKIRKVVKKDFYGL